MEISIKINGIEAGLAGVQAGTGATAQASSQIEPPAELAARAAATGAINAGPAHIPDGGFAEPVANVTAAAGEQQSGDAASAGPAPGSTQEPEPVVVEQGDVQQ